MRLDSGSGEVTWFKADVAEEVVPPVLPPITAETGIRARNISTNALCSALRRPWLNKIRDSVLSAVPKQQIHFPFHTTPTPSTY